MGGISFPSEVQGRIEVLQRIDRLHEKASASIIRVLKTKTLLPIALGRDVPPELSRPSITTTALAATRLSKTNKTTSLFTDFFSECQRSVARRHRLSSGTFGDNNPMTASFIALSHRKYKREASPAFGFALDVLLDWLKKDAAIRPWHGYPASLCAEVLGKPTSLDISRRRRATGALVRLANWAQEQVMEQITHFHSSHIAYFDVGQLALTTFLACKLETLFWRSPITTCAVDIVFECQSEDGMWYSSKPFWHTSGRATILASCQVMSAATRLLRHRTDLFKKYEKQVYKYVDWLESSISEIDRGKTSILGWASEANLSSDRIDIWITLENLAVLGDLSNLIQRLNRDELLHRSGLVVNWKPIRWSKLLPPDLSLPAEKQLKSQLTTLFIKPWKLNKRLDRCSIVLYGPPGTSKTTVAGALADAMGAKKPWPLITIGPGDFIAGGEPMAEINAANIFRVLMELKEVVILFDEIDQLLLERRPGMGGGALQFMTTSMLTKFQSLRQRKQNIFVLTTNRFEGLDTAVRRAGRFDGHIAVMPPDHLARKAILSFLIKKYDDQRGTSVSTKLTTQNLKTIAISTTLFTYPELESMTSNVLESLPPKASAASVVNELMSAARTYSKATAFRAYKDRKDALMEIDALVRTITKAEYLQMENDDKADLEVLGQMLRESQFSGRVPVWLGKSKTQVVGKLTTSRADV
jgi:hypothetical protein